MIKPQGHCSILKFLNAKYASIRVSSISCLSQSSRINPGIVGTSRLMTRKINMLNGHCITKTINPCIDVQVVTIQVSPICCHDRRPLAAPHINLRPATRRCGELQLPPCISQCIMWAIMPSDPEHAALCHHGP